jgi:bisphosphoglycerate-dependent phosphoglycerate mutase
MSKLFLASHGEFNDDSRGPIYGHLSESGREEARALGERLGEYEVHLAYASMSQPSRTTMGLILAEVACCPNICIEFCRELNDDAGTDSMGEFHKDRIEPILNAGEKNILIVAGGIAVERYLYSMDSSDSVPTESFGQSELHYPF